MEPMKVFVPVPSSETQSSNENLENVVKVGNNKYSKFHYFYLYIFSGYHLCMVPFRLQINHDSGQYTLTKVNIFRKILVFVVCLITLSRTLVWIREIWKYSHEHELSLLSYFYMVTGHSHLLFLLVYFKSIWFQWDKMENLVKAIGSCSLLQKIDRYRMAKYAAVIIFHLGLIIVGFCAEICRNDCRPNSIRHSLLQLGRAVLFINDSNTTNHGLDIFLSICGFMTMIVASIQLPFLLGWLGLSSFTLWEATTGLVAMVENKQSEASAALTVSKIKEKFHELDRLARAVNAMWSSVCLYQIIHTFSFFCSEMDSLLKSANYLLKIRSITIILYVTAGCIISAECSRNVAHLEYFLVNRTSDDGEVESLLRKIDVSTLCIGERNLYRIDYGFVCTLVVTVITFFIIFVQSPGRRDASLD